MRNGVETKHNYANYLLPITTNHNIGCTAFADVHSAQCVHLTTVMTAGMTEMKMRFAGCAMR